MNGDAPCDKVGNSMPNTEEIKVSVIMPIYNAYDYLRPAMDSVIDQTLREIEIICVDDGSTDHSLDIIKEYRDADSRVRIITENNAGPSIARNKGLSRARGDYVIFLDADDFYEPTLLEKLYDLALKDDLDITIAKYDIYNSRKATFEKNVKIEHGDIFEPGRVVSKNEYPDQILQATTGYVWNKLFRKAFLLEKNLCFQPELRVFEDVYFVVTALSMASRVGKVFECLVHHRVYSGQSKNKLFKKYYKQVPVLYSEIKEFLRANGMYIPLSRSFLNLSATRCYSIYSLLWRDGKSELWDMLHTEYAEILGWCSVAPEDFERADVRNFVSNVLLYNHKQYQNRTKRGASASGVDRAVKRVKFRKKVKEFFSRLLPKKKQ